MAIIIEALAEAVISSLLGSVTNLLKEKVHFILHSEDDLKELQKKLERFQKAIKDVDRKPFFSNQRDRDREGELKDVLYDAQDIIEKYRTKIEVNKRGKHSILQNKVQKLWCPMRSSFNEHVSFPYWLGKKIKKVNKKLDQINIDREMVDLGILKTTPEGGEGPISGEHDNSRETTQHIGAQTPIGREDDKEKIKKILLHCSMESGVQEEHVVSIISIVGQGGIGKTTLAKMVFGEVEEQFGEHRWWVCVSERPNRKDLLRRILKEMPRTSKKEPEDINSLSLGDLCTQLRSELSKKRFLLVLDDVWELDWWHGEVEGTLMKGAMGSKILITTRNEHVSNGMNASYMHKVPKLTFDKSWILFLKMASKEESELVSHNLKDIATKIVRKCGGLPLVIQTVGSLMRTKKMKDDWETIEKSEIWEWKMAASSTCCEYGGILPGLILSYDDLPLPLKSCFVYCSIFPKDYVIKREKLIMQWVAHELTEENKGIDVEVTTNLHVDDLIRRCLIEETKNGDLKLHDILHDLASYIGRKEYSHALATEHTHHLSLLGPVNVEAMPSASRGENKLRTLLSDHRQLSSIRIIADLTNFKWLRVLSLEHCEIYELPQSIGYLSLLKYLDLSYSFVRKLPTSIGKLCNLQTMNLNESHIEELPKEIGELYNLRYLGLEWTHKLSFIAEGLGKLSNLQTLKRFLICDDRGNTSGCNMRELRGLNKLKGELSIEGLGGKRKAIHHAPQLLKEKCGLYSLKLVFSMQRGENVASASEQCDTLEALEPPHGLKKLEIYHYKGQMPAWLLQPNYAMLQTLKLEDCPTLCEIRSIPFLKFLDVCRCDGLNTIGQLPALESLKVDHCGSLELVADMPTVKSMAVRHSNGLKTLANMPALESLEVDHCGSLELVADMPTVKSMDVWNSNGLKTLANMPVLQSLMVYHCDVLEQVVDMPALKSLNVLCCSGLRTLTKMPALRSLVVHGCNGVEQVADLSALKSLVVKRSNGLKTLANMPALKSLEVVECDGLEVVSNIASLEYLRVDRCDGLQQVADDMPALKVLRLIHLNTLKRLPTCLPSLEELDVIHAPNWEGWPAAGLDSALPSPLLSEVSTFLPSLKRLRLWDNDEDLKWGRVPEWVWGLSQLEVLQLHNFTEEISLGSHWQYLQNLRVLWLYKFPRLKSLVDINIIPQENDGVEAPATDANEQIACLSRLQKLQIGECPTLDLPQELINCLKERLRISDGSLMDLLLFCNFWDFRDFLGCN